MKKKIPKVLIVLLYFTPCNIIILIYILSAWCGSYITEQTYYIPEIGKYMKIYNTGPYVAFGDSINFTLSQSTSYFNLLSVMGARIILNPMDKNIIYVDYLVEKGKLKNVIKFNNSNDSLFFRSIRSKENGPILYKLKYPYICIGISEYASAVSINDKNMNHSKNLKPIIEREYYNPLYFKSQFSWLIFWKKDKGLENNVDFIFNLPLQTASINNK